MSCPYPNHQKIRELLPDGSCHICNVCTEINLKIADWNDRDRVKESNQIKSRNGRWPR